MKAEKSALQKLIYGLACIVLRLSLCGVNYCQRDFEFAPNASVDETPTPTNEPTETPDDSDLITNSPTPDATADPLATATPSPEATETPAATATNEAESSALFLALRALPTASSHSAGSDGNWLGQLGHNSKVAQLELVIDSDGDGYSDQLEAEQGTDLQDPNLYPARPKSKMILRFRGFDDDYDGFSNEDEIALGTDPARADSDGDHLPDGIEILMGVDPRNPNDLLNDSDGDGLSDEFESGLGTALNHADTDKDGVRDDLEIILGTNPLGNDTDRDGVLDGREVELGADPTVKDY